MPTDRNPSIERPNTSSSFAVATSTPVFTAPMLLATSAVLMVLLLSLMPMSHPPIESRKRLLYPQKIGPSRLMPMSQEETPTFSM